MEYTYHVCYPDILLYLNQLDVSQRKFGIQIRNIIVVVIIILTTIIEVFVVVLTVGSMPMPPIVLHVIESAGKGISLF